MRPSLLPVLVLAALDVVAAAQCEGPYNTLSSDCRGLTNDTNTVCLVLDQHTASEPSPCLARGQGNECAVRTGASCDIVTYRIDYQASRARFRITFPTSNDGMSLRRLVDMAGSLGETPTVTAAPSTKPPEHFEDHDSQSPTTTTTPAPTSGRQPLTPTLIDYTPSPTETPATPYPTVAPATPAPTDASPIPVASPAPETTPASTSGRQPLTPTLIDYTPAPTGSPAPLPSNPTVPPAAPPAPTVTPPAASQPGEASDVSMAPSPSTGPPEQFVDHNPSPAPSAPVGTLVDANPSTTPAPSSGRQPLTPTLIDYTPAPTAVPAALAPNPATPTVTPPTASRPGESDGASSTSSPSTGPPEQFVDVTPSPTPPHEVLIPPRNPESPKAAPSVPPTTTAQPTPSNGPATTGSTPTTAGPTPLNAPSGVTPSPAPPGEATPPSIGTLGNSVSSLPSTPLSPGSPGTTRVVSHSGSTSTGPPSSSSAPAVGTLVDASTLKTPTGGPTTTSPSSALVTATPPPVDPSSESNEFVQAIGQLRLDPSVTELRIVGGSSEFGTRGKAVQLTIDPQMLVQSPHVTSVWISNFNISSQLAAGGVLSGMPNGLTDLILRNTLMQVEPADLSALPNLKSLQLVQNYLTTLSRNTYLPLLTSLDVSDNLLTSFDAGFPALESLSLNKNKFNTIPTAVYAMPKLQELQLTENPIVAIVVSTTQFDIVAKLRLKVDKPPITPPTPAIYVAENANTTVVAMSESAGNPTAPATAEVVGLDLNSSTVELTHAVAKPVGTLVDLQGIPVWKLTDAEYNVFQAQQEVIASNDVVIGGTKVQPYLVMAASAASAATTTPAPTTTTSPSTDSQTTTVPSETSHGSSKSHTTLAIVLVSVAAAAVLIVGLVFVVCRRRKSSKNGHSTETTLTTPTDHNTTTTYQVANDSKNNTGNSVESFGVLGSSLTDANVRDVFSQRRIRVADLEDVRPIAAGATGIVWLVKHRGAKLLASKRLIQPTSQRTSEFVNEIVIAADLNYPRIVRLVGIAWTDESDLQALYEYMPNGDLQSHLQSTPTDAHAWRGSTISMAIDIVEALVYTHSFNPPLLHRDLRARNVLLDDDMKPKLSNFASARFASEQNTMTADGVGSGRWLAPEVLSGSTDYDTPSDMYAFGVLLSELDTHTTPYADARDANGNAMAETQILALVGSGDLRPSFSASCPSQIRDIAMLCLSQNPQDRPTAMRVAYELRSLVREWSL